jgi:hypothetical protein
MTRGSRRGAYREISPETLARIAGIMGASSAAAKALADIATRHANGEDPACYSCGDMLFVGSRVETIGTAEAETSARDA